MSDHRIFHLAVAERWRTAAVGDGAYVPDEYATEGFIHCSTADQVLATANLYYRGRRDLVLLELDPGELGDALVWEAGTGGRDELFPHLYAAIDCDGVRRVIDIRPDSDGAFADLP